MSQDQDLNAGPRAKWEDLRKEIVERIKAIDGETVANPANPMAEPEWWLAMQDVERAAIRAGRAQS